MKPAPTDWIGSWAFLAPQQIAAKQMESGSQLTYSELNQWCNGLVSLFFNQYGCRKGDRIAILAENCLEHLILFGAAQKSGLILVPVNYRLARNEIRNILDLTRPRLIIAGNQWTPLLPDDRTAAIIRIEELMSKLKNAGDPIPTKMTPVEAIDPIFILYTSGTTGLPKGVLYTQGMLEWNSFNTALALIVNSGSRILNVMPFFHTGGWNVLVTPTLHHGGTVCIAKRFDASSTLSWLEKEKITLFMAVPTMLRMMADEPSFQNTDLSALWYLIVGGEPMPVPLIERWHNHEVLVRQGYGMTEAGPNLTSLHHQDAVRKAGSIGKPNFYVHHRIVNESGHDVPVGHTGELWIKGPMVTPGYWEQPDSYRESFSGDWLRTGDLVRQDEEGDLYVVDRIKNMYISGGENVYPAEIERVLRQHPEVEDVIVIGVPDSIWGESGKAFIVPKSGMIPDTASLLEFCRANLAKFKIPKDFQFIRELPLNDAGKVDRIRLKTP
ncbi:MAG TPA: AMP-binding protein [Saprospiraceae bacterium]|nr:AMP-binding protein [Saprospiraceae bacterium]